MPNFRLDNGEIEDLIKYMENETRRLQQTVANAPDQQHDGHHDHSGHHGDHGSH